MDSYEKRTWWSKHGMTERLTSEAFLEAAVTGAFLIAAADGAASEVEYDALLDRLEILGGVDRDKVDKILTDVSNQLENASGNAPQIARIGELITSREAAEAAFMLALAVALADDDFSAEEREVAKQLSLGIGLGGCDLEAMLAALRG